MLGAKSTDATDVDRIRMMLGEKVKPYTNVELQRLLDHVGDLDLTITALLMVPRPKWLTPIMLHRGI